MIWSLHYLGLQDGLFLITNQPELVIGYPLAILTPNVTEHKRLVAKIVGEKNQEAPVNWREISDEDLAGQLQELAKKYAFLLSPCIKLFFWFQSSQKLLGKRAEKFMQIRVKYWMKIPPKIYSVLVRVMKYAEDYLWTSTTTVKKLLLLYAKQSMEHQRGPTPDKNSHRVII